MFFKGLGWVSCLSGADRRAPLHETVAIEQLDVAASWTGTQGYLCTISENLKLF